MIYPVVTPCPENPRLWLLHSTMEIHTRAGRLRIISGFVTDGASIPRLPGFWLLIGHPMQGDVLPAAICHDGLYSAKITTRKMADQILLDIMCVYAVNRVKARIIWAAVRLFGWAAWCGRKMSSVRAARAFVHLR